MHAKSIKLNAVLNVIKALLSVIFPLITYPYATRVLGVENLGKVNFSSSIITYFSLLAALGITSYAIREGAKVRQEKEKFEKFANEVFSINLITTIFSYILLVIILLVAYKLREYRLLILIHSMIIIFTTLGVDWVNSIYEDYIYIALRSLIINIISMVCLFVFVKQATDYYIYALLTVISNGLICISNFFYCRKYIKFKFTKKINFIKHIKYMLIFFANNLAVSIYVNADITMLGVMSSNYSVGLYSVAVKVYSILKNIFAAIYMVTLPRLTYLISNNHKEEYKELASKICSIIILILLPCAAGLFILAPDIIMILSGEAFINAFPVLRILSIAIIFALLGGIITQCVYISLGREKINLKATIISAVVNVVLNIYFISTYNEVGAAITTAISEFIVLVYCLLKFKDMNQYFYREKIIKNLIIAIIGMTMVLIIGSIIQTYITNLIFRFALTIVISCIIYFVLLLITKNELLIDNIKFKKEK